MLKLKILFLIMVPLLLLGCGNNNKKSWKENLGQSNNVETLQLIDISIEGEAASTSFRAQKNLDISDIHGQGIIFRLYSDGTAIYSGDDFEVGPPYYTIKIPQDQITGFFDDMKRHEIFSGETQLFYSGPSSGCVRIYLNNDGQTLWFCSWHELYEDNPNLIVTEDGVFPLEGRDKTKIIESQDEDYKLFLSKWKFIRDSVKNLIKGS